VAGQPRVLIVLARFYDDIADALLAGARAVLDAAGAEVEMIEVPGAFEVPGAIAFAHRSGRYDGYVALGCVIRGETSHYDLICSESARGLSELAAHHGAALGYGILTTDTREQALVRAAVDRGNKGGDAARACLRMIEVSKKFAAQS
jgi:6,7-dimethyl-8-ribityllumazine synthase